MAVSARVYVGQCKWMLGVCARVCRVCMCVHQCMCPVCLHAPELGEGVCACVCLRECVYERVCPNV